MFSCIVKTHQSIAFNSAKIKPIADIKSHVDNFYTIESNVHAQKRPIFVLMLSEGK